MRPLSGRAFNLRRDGLYARCDRLGRTAVRDLGGNMPDRKLIVDLVVPHAVSVLPGGSGESRHYFAFEVDLLAAHEEFEGQNAAGRPIDCRGLRSID